MFDNLDWSAVIEKLKLDITSIVSSLIVIAIILIVAKLALNRLTKLTTKGMEDAKKMDDRQKGKDLMTSMTVVRSLGRYVIYLLAILAIFYQLGYGSAFSNVLTAAGIGTLAISFGAQSIVQDVVTGLFLLFEKQYGVGDYVKINDYSGTVSAIAVRCTYINSWKGERIVIPNGQIKTVTNYSGEFNMAVIEVPTSYEDDTMTLKNIIQKTADDYYESHQDICYAAPNVKAITAYNDSNVLITVYLKAKGRNHYTIQNDLRLLIKQDLEKAGYSIPYNQLVVHEAEK